MTNILRELFLVLLLVMQHVIAPGTTTTTTPDPAATVTTSVLVTTTSTVTITPATTIAVPTTTVLTTTSNPTTTTIALGTTLGSSTSTMAPSPPAPSLTTATTTTADPFVYVTLPALHAHMSSTFNTNPIENAFDSDTSTCVFTGIHSTVTLRFPLDAPHAIRVVKLLSVSTHLESIWLQVRGITPSGIVVPCQGNAAFERDREVNIRLTCPSVEVDSVEVVALFDKFGQLRLCEVLVAF